MCDGDIDKNWQDGYDEGYEQGKKDAQAKSLNPTFATQPQKEKKWDATGRSCPGFKPNHKCPLGSTFVCGSRSCRLHGHDMTIWSHCIKQETDDGVKRTEGSPGKAGP